MWAGPLVLCAGALLAAAGAGAPPAPECGYQGCADAVPGALNVHIVAHTHDDLGWVRTVDEYYEDSVREILDSVIRELYGHPHRKFTYVETAFFWRWWLQQTRATRARVRRLVRGGRLALAGGAWAMNDEAAAHYQGIVDQFTWGLQKLVGAFGACGAPVVGWQIDPFGHSREFAALLAGAGYDGLFLGRIDSQDMTRRQNERALEFVWRGDDDLGSSSDMFASVLYDRYDDPPGFCYDEQCGDPPPNDERVHEFLEYAREAAAPYPTGHVLLTFGRDFAFRNATQNFQHIDTLIELTNRKAARSGRAVKAFYSTPACYLKAVKDADPVLPTKQDDFFPYASSPHAYWTGYFTSRPAAKRQEREANGWLQMVKQLQVLADLNDSNTFAIDELKSALGVMQHHDAITGTARQYVAQDYTRQLHAAMQQVLLVPRAAINRMLLAKSTETGSPPLDFQSCQLNESRCEVSEKSRQFIVAVYNPLAWRVSAPVRIPVIEADYAVYAPNGKRIVSQLVQIPPHVVRLPTRRSAATHEVVFVAHLKPLMLKTYFIERKRTSRARRSRGERRQHMALDYDLANEHIKLSINYTTGNITRASLADGTHIKFHIQFGFYPGAGGAYVFQPDVAAPVGIATRLAAPGPRGPVVQEVTAESDTASSVVRIYSGLGYIENDWVVGPIDVEDSYGKNYIVRYVTDVANNAQFYSDSNGRQMLKRILNRRPQWDLEVEEPVAGNYYPVTNKIYIEDDEKRVAVLTDRSEGGTSLREGQIELMLHRRLRKDDGFGVGEALNEMENGLGLVVRGTHRILITRLQSHTDILEEKKQVFQMHLQPNILMVNANKLPNMEGLVKPFDKWMSLKKSVSFANALPEGVHLLSLEPWGESKFLLRLENFLEKADKKKTTVEVDLGKMFKYIHVVSYNETCLTGHRLTNEKQKWTWKTKHEFMRNFNEAYGNNKTIKLRYEDTEKVNNDNGTKVKLTAKQIRTFIVLYRIKLTEYAK